MLEADVRVLEWREALRQEVDRKPKQADELARLLRTMNAAIGVASGRLADLEALPAPVPVVAELQAIHQTALSSSVGTLATTVRDVAAYRLGASDVVRTLDPLERLMGELALAAGVPTPVEGPSPSPSSSSAVSPAP